MSNKLSVVIDCYFNQIQNFDEDCAFVVIDIFRSSTTSITANELGRRCFFVPSVNAAWNLASKLDNALLVGENGGKKPSGFDLNNSPWAINQRSDFQRPMILLSSSGTPLMCKLNDRFPFVFISCFRNYIATVNYLVENFSQVVLISPSTRGEFREEDQICSTWMAVELLKKGYTIKDEKTAAIVDTWKDVSIDACTLGKSAEYLRNSGQIRDLLFTIRRVNDLDSVFTIRACEIIKNK